MRRRLDEIGQSVEEALEELREVSHGLYPPTLADWGLATALERIRAPAAAELSVSAPGVERQAPELEAAVYYCCLEAIQNATKHGGPGVRIAVTLRQQANALTFHVTDDGPGFETAAAHAGAGLQNMRDRLGALDGRLSIASRAGSGTLVVGVVPLPDRDVAERPPRSASAASDEASGAPFPG